MTAPVDPRAALGQLGAIWSDDFDAYASGQLDASRVHCALCMCAPCRCPAFGTPEYFALIDFRHGRTRRAPTPSPDRAARDARAVQLDRMARYYLVKIAREHGGTWLTGGPETWGKDELVAEILRAEFPEGTS
jgi:hypothetical protein